MRLREVLDRIAASSADEWHEVPGFPTPGDVMFELGSSSSEMSITGVRCHYQAAVLLEAPEISIAWGLELDRDLQFDFAQRMTDRRVSSFAVDVMFNGSVVHRETFVDVDGGRAYLLMPAAMVSSVTLGEGELIAEQISEWQDRFASLINRLVGLREYESYRYRAGFVVIAGHPLDPR